MAQRESESIEVLAKRENDLKAQLEKAQNDLFSVQGALLGFRERCSMKVKELEDGVAELREKLEAKANKLGVISRERDSLSQQVNELMSHSYQQEMVISSMQEQFSIEKKKQEQSASRNQSPFESRRRQAKEKSNEKELEMNMEKNLRIERLQRENEALRKELKGVKERVTEELMESMKKASRPGKASEIDVKAERDEETIEKGARNLRELNRLKEHLSSLLKTPASRGTKV